MKKICVLTGKRGGYGAMKPMLRLIRDDPYFELDFVAGDMHLREDFGNTLDEIQDEFDVTPLELAYKLPDTKYHRACQISYHTELVAKHLEKSEPDLLMLYGDRGETLAAAIAALEFNVPIAHLQGGDTSGTMDDRRRRAITALADLHFVSHDKAADSVSDQLNLADDRIFVVGDSHLDPIFDGELYSMDKVMKELTLMRDFPIIIVLFHPDPTDPRDDNLTFHNIMDAIDDIDKQFVIIYPCSDPGWKKIVKAIHWFDEHPNIQIYKNLPSPLFLGLMNCASVIVGNSSCGLIEAPYMDLPCVNVGNRQKGRLQSTNVINVGHTSHEIDSGFQLAMYLKRNHMPFEKPYGNGATGKRIVNILKREWFND